MLGAGLLALGAGLPTPAVARPQVSQFSVGRTAFGRLTWRVVLRRGGFVLRGWLKINTLVRRQSWMAGVELACPASPRRSGFGPGGVPQKGPTPATQGVRLYSGFVSQNRIVVAS